MAALDINEDPVFQARFWKLQRVSWACGGIILLAAAAGLTGSGGVFARGSALVGGGTFQYDRFARQEAATRLEFKASESHPGTVIHLDSRYLEGVRIVRIQPEPESVAADADGCSFHFSGSPASIRLDVIPKRPGILRGVFAVDGAVAAFSQRVLP